LALAALASAQMTVGGVQISGNRRIASDTIVAFTGLHEGKNTSDRQLRAICQKLVDSGFFTSANYSYSSQKSGSEDWRYTVTLAVTEDSTLTRAVLDLDDAQPETVWRQLAAINPLIGPVMPDNDLAQAAYQKALDSTLSGPDHPFRSEAKREVDLKTGQMVVVFRDANRPKLVALQFEGNHAVDSATLNDALRHVILGEPYSEREVSNMAGLNLRRLYDSLGYLSAAFPKVTLVNPGAPEAIAKITIEEGPRWKLGIVSFSGKDLPEAAMRKAGDFHSGTIANWDFLTASIEQARRVVTTQGYLHAGVDTQRTFNSSQQTVDLLIVVNKGPQFLFGDLLFDGIDSDHQDLLSRRWEIKSGAPLNEVYADNFIRQIYPLAGRRIQHLQRKFLPHAGSLNVLDVKYEIQ
jgi:outer membrane protein assembly factor BamA